MKKKSLKALNLDSADFLQREQLKTVLGGSGSCTLTCTIGGTYPNPVGSDCLSVGNSICYHFGGPGSVIASCSCS